jgi:hypothetical protein
MAPPADPAPPGPHNRKRRLVVAASAAAAVVIGAVAAVLATQGGGAPQQTPAQILAAAAHKEAGLHSLTATFSEQLAGPPYVTISASMAVARNPLRMSIAMTENVGSRIVHLSMVFSGQRIYVKFGAVPGMPPAIAGKWLEVPLAAVGGGQFASMLQTLENQNPASQTQMLPAAQHVRVAGTQVIDGVTTTKYVGSMNAAAALKRLPAAERAIAGRYLKLVTGKIGLTIWIDHSDQIRQLVEHETVVGHQVTATIRFRSFNQPVTITVPPANEVVPFPGMRAGGTGA